MSSQAQLDPKTGQVPSPSSWQPRWIVKFPDGITEVGITVDDHCVVTLVKDGAGRWRPTPWVPLRVADRIAELLRTREIDD